MQLVEILEKPKGFPMKKALLLVALLLPCAAQVDASDDIIPKEATVN